MGEKRKHDGAEEAEESEVTGFVQDGTLYLRDGSNRVYSSARNWRGELVAVGRWDGSCAQLEAQETAPSGGWGALATVRDAVEDGRRTEELTREIGAHAQRKQLAKATELYDQVFSLNHPFS